MAEDLENSTENPSPTSSPSQPTTEQVEGEDGEKQQTTHSNGDCSGLHVTTSGCFISGWLSMRSRFTKKWKKRWFRLEKNCLHHGSREQKLTGKIFLDGCKIRETVKDKKPFAFSIESKSGHRVYYLQAEDEQTRNKWMHALCFAKFSHGSEEKSSLCTISWYREINDKTVWGKAGTFFAGWSFRFYSGSSYEELHCTAWNKG